METLPPSSRRGYRGVLTTIGAFYVLLAVLNVTQGAATVLEPFSVPDDVLKSPYFLDLYHWHFAHMGNIGVLLLVLARVVTGMNAQRAVVLTLIGCSCSTPTWTGAPRCSATACMRTRGPSC